MGIDDLQVVRVGTSLPLGQWCHMAAVSGPGGMHLYLDGVLLEQNGFEGSFAAIGPTVDNYLGRSNWKDNGYFRGQLDEVRVWSVARSGEQIRAAMGQRLTGDEPGLVGLWDFDDGDGRDRSGHGHAGQLRGGAVCVAAPFPGQLTVPPPAVVAGTVRGETGLPLVNADVRLRTGGAEVAWMGNRQDGHYALAVFGDPPYTIEAALAGSWPQWITDSAVFTRQADVIGPESVPLQPGRILHRDLTAPSTKMAWWHADGDARDALGANDGVLMGDATFAPGLLGQAFRLHGDPDQVRVTQPSGLTPTGSFSLVAWVLPTADAPLAVVTASAYSLLVDAGLSVTFRATDEGHAQDRRFQTLRSPANVITRDTWNLVAAVYDQATGTRRIDVNGVEVARRQDPAFTAWMVTDLEIGRTFAGLVDEVAIYRRAWPVSRSSGSAEPARKGDGRARAAPTTTAAPTPVFWSRA